MDWKEITPHLYNNIKPTKGYLSSVVDESSVRKKRFSNLWIEFEMNAFMYEDPFYGEQKSTAPFNMEINLIDLPKIYELGAIHKLQGFEIHNDPKSVIGAFSNSLHLTVPLMKFGQIQNQTIPVDIEYCLTNSYSYGMMSGTIDDHLTLTGNIKQDLHIKNLIVINSNNRPLKPILKQLDKDIYDIKNVEEATDTLVSYPDRTQYYVKYKNIDPRLRKKKKWWYF